MLTSDETNGFFLCFILHFYCGQGALYALRPEDFRRGVSSPVVGLVWALPKLYSLAYWRNRILVTTPISLDLYTSGVRQPSTLAYT